MLCTRLVSLSTMIALFVSTGCEKTAVVDLQLIEPCDQENRALRPAKTVRISYSVPDPDTGLPGAIEDGVSFNPAGGTETLRFPLSENVFVTVQGFDRDVEVDGAAALTDLPRAIGRSVPLAVDSDNIRLVMPVGLRDGFGRTTTRDEDGDTSCTSLDAGGAVAGRLGHTATFIPAIGQVLIAGGAVLVDDAGTVTTPAHCRAFPGPGGGTVTRCLSPVNTAELYDPATGTFRRLVVPDAKRPYRRAFHTATLLSDGVSVLLSGGFGFINGELTALQDAVLIDAERVAAGEDGYRELNLSEPRALHTATLVPSSGEVVLVGGCRGRAADGCSPWQVGRGPNGDATKALTQVVETFNPTSVSFVPASFAPGEVAAVGRAFHAASFMGTFIVVTGGIDADGPRCGVEVLEATANGIVRRAVDGTVATLTECPLGHAQVTVARDAVALVGGFTAAPDGVPAIDGQASRKVWFWSTTGLLTNRTVEMLTGRAWHRAMLLQDGDILVIGGQIATGGASAERLDRRADDTFATSALDVPPVTARALPATALLPNNQVFVAGGYEPIGGVASAETLLYFGD